MPTRTVSCAECGATFETRSARARFCPGNPACRKAASRRPSKLGRRELQAQEAAGDAAAPHPVGLRRVPTLTDVLAELDATAELLDRDLDVLEERFPQGSDEVMDELIGGLATYLQSIAGLRAFVTAGPS